MCRAANPRFRPPVLSSGKSTHRSNADSNPFSHPIMTPQTNNQSGALAISRGRITRPQKAVIYGPEGVGKSTFASLTPAPVFLDTEGGTHHLDVIRLDAASTWDEITATVTQLAKTQHPFRTLVIDTADWLEKRLSEHLCRKANKDSIEDFGYGKGWVLLTEEFARFLNSLDVLLARGMHVVFLAHSTVKKFEAPDQAGSYDRFELKLSKSVAPLLKEWADLVLFANYVTRIAEKDSGKNRGVGGKERVLFATHSAAYDAKNRHGLPDKLPFSMEALAPVFGAQATPLAMSTLAAPAKSTADRIFDAFGSHMANVVDFLVARGQLKYTTEGSLEDIGNLDPAYATRILSDPKRFLKAVEEFHQAKEVAAAQ